MGSTPRARRPSPVGVPPHGRVTAVGAILVLLAHLLLAQLTLGLAVVFTVVGRASRWRPGWLAVPAAAGLVWVLAVGPGPAAAAFAAGPARVLAYLGRGGLLERPGRLGRSQGPFAGAGGWLPGQLPFALIAGAAEAWLIGWLDSRRPSRAALRQHRPGLVAAIRAALACTLIRSGTVVTRDGCALGVDPATGAVVQLRWPEIAGGLLVTGAADQEVTVTGLQLAHAALRRRKPLIVIDVSHDDAIARALTAACAATGVVLHHQQAGSDLSPVISERSAALLRVGSPGQAARASAGVAALAAALRRIGVDGDGLIWVTGGERLPASAVADLIDGGRSAGLAVVIGTTSAAATADLAGLVSAVLASSASSASSAVDRGISAVSGAGLGPGISPAVARAGVGIAPAAGELLSLRPGEFALGLNGPRGREVRRGRLVSARLPRPASGPGRRRRGSSS